MPGRLEDHREAELLGRQDRRNQGDAAFVAGLEALYDAGSVRFYLGFANLLRGALAVVTLIGLSLPFLVGGAIIKAADNKAADDKAEKAANE